MGTIALYIVIGGLGLFIAYMFIVTSSMGTERLKVAQFLMSSLTYSEEADTKLNLLMDKLESGLLTVKKSDKFLVFVDKETNSACGEIFIGSKYYSYGNLYRYGLNNSNEWSCNKPKIKTFKRIMKLEQSLEKNTPTTNSTNTTSSKKGEEVVLD